MALTYSLTTPLGIAIGIEDDEARDACLLRDDQRAMSLADVDAHRDETWFAWYGATDGTPRP